MAKRKSKTELFLELAKLDENGVSRWVDVSEFTGKYERLQIRNGGHCCRKGSLLARNYIVELDKSRTQGSNIDAIRLNGHRDGTTLGPKEKTIDERKNKHLCSILNETDYNYSCDVKGCRESELCKKCKKSILHSIFEEAYSKRKQMCLGKLEVEIAERVINRIYSCMYDYEVEQMVWRCLSEKEPSYD